MKPDFNTPTFKKGDKVTAELINAIISDIEKAARQNEISISPLKIFSKGDPFTASDLNNIITKINAIYEKIGLTTYEWSNDNFQTGDSFTATNLNEIIEAKNKLKPSSI